MKEHPAGIALDIVSANNHFAARPAGEVVPVSGTVWRQGQDGFGFDYTASFSSVSCLA
jgi:hypothetical protein